MSRISGFLSCTAALLMLGVGAANAADFRTIEGARPENDPERIEVIEFFWYGCPHCYRFAPHIARWKESRADDVSFEHIPAVLSPTWELHGKAFYAAKLLGVLDTFHGAMFDAIHQQNRRMDSATEIGEFAASLGIDGDKFVATLESFAVDAKIRRAKSLQRAYGVTGTPSVVIDGRYITSGSTAGGLDEMIEVINDRVVAVRGESG